MSPAKNCVSVTKKMGRMDTGGKGIVIKYNCYFPVFLLRSFVKLLSLSSLIYEKRIILTSKGCYE